MKIVALIPARMGSSRFPGKPMARILGEPMIGHVYRRVKDCDLLNDVVVATCDKEIMEYIESVGGTAIMTSDSHERASDRCAEALLKLETVNGQRYDIAVMVQGDEPMTHPEMISQAVAPMLTDESILVSNLVGDIRTEKEFEDRNCIKVVCDREWNALYFSREAIPTRSISKEISMKKQICIIPFRRDFLLQYNKLEPTPLELAESIDMMRVLEHGMDVRMIPTSYSTHAVDTEEDLKLVENLMLKSKS